MADAPTVSIVIPTHNAGKLLRLGIGSIRSKTTYPDFELIVVNNRSNDPGTLAYFEGEFKATKSTYQGDLVIRDVGDYECNNGATGAINGDLWVLHGGLRITDDCTVTGSVYARNLIEVNNHNLTVGADIISVAGPIKLNATGVDIGGSVLHHGIGVSASQICSQC